MNKNSQVEEKAAKEDETLAMIKSAPARQMIPGVDLAKMTAGIKDGTERMGEAPKAPGEAVIDGGGGVSAPGVDVEIATLEAELAGLEQAQAGGWGDLAARSRRIEELRGYIEMRRVQKNPQAALPSWQRPAEGPKSLSGR